MVALTAEEIAVMRDEIAKGLLPPDAIEKYLEAEALNVFGTMHAAIETAIG